MGKTYKDEESARRIAWVGKRKKERNHNPNKYNGPPAEWWEDRAGRIYLDLETSEVSYDDAGTL